MEQDQLHTRGDLRLAKKEDVALAPRRKRAAVDKGEELQNLPSSQENWEGSKCPRKCGGHVQLNVKPGSRHVRRENILPVNYWK